MGMLVNGKWENMPVVKQDQHGNFIRPQTIFHNWITDQHNDPFPAAPNRYHLYVSYACPWACRTLIFRVLKGLEDVISFSVVAPVMREHGWEFSATDELRDPLYDKKYLYEIYLTADPKCSGKVTVPVLWDKQQKTIVNNESAEIIRMLNSAFHPYAKNNYDFYPMALRSQIDEINEFVYTYVNNGVYKCGFASSQAAYEQAFDELFSALDELEKRLSQQPYLVGKDITEADWRLFTTLIRFDVVYVGHFKCNLKRMTDYPYLSRYLHRLYEMPGIKQTVNFYHIKQHYYRSHPQINPSGIVPKGPQLDFD